jgi:ParB family chromosome partitioning protein
MPTTTAKPQTTTKRTEGQATGNAPNGHKPPDRQASQSPHSKKLNKQTSHQWLIVTIAVERIEPSPYQPRLSFDAAEMADLVASVRAKGVQQPIIVRTCKAGQEALQNGATHTPNGKANGKADGKVNGATKPSLVRYELIAGERRLRACKEAGRQHIPAIVRDDLTDVECAELALLENVQRSNLSVIEEARGYKRLMLQFRMKEERIAKKVGKSVGTIRDLLKLLQLPETVQKLLAEKKLTASHGQELLALAPYERVCVLVAEKAARDRLTALSLQSTPLPNAAELKRLGLIAELDWRTKFDWKSECGKCPHKA